MTSSPCILLVVGNGLSLDLAATLRSTGLGISPSTPLSWQFSVPDTSRMRWQDAFPGLAAELGQAQYADLTDFDKLSRVLQHKASLPFDRRVRLDAEARQFLAFGYSDFQREVDHRGIPREWQWFGWLRQHASAIPFVLSFNYDLVLERALSAAGLSIRAFPVATTATPMVLAKPHGSIDFATDPRAIAMPPTTYPLKNVATLNDVPLLQIPDAELGRSRQEAFITLPLEYSPYLGHQWVAPGYQHLQATSPAFTHAVFVGLSYWPADRPEIDFLLDCLPKHAKVIEANPKPEPEFARAVSVRGLSYLNWKEAPEPVAGRAV